MQGSEEPRKHTLTMPQFDMKFTPSYLMYEWRILWKNIEKGKRGIGDRVVLGDLHKCLRMRGKNFCSNAKLPFEGCKGFNCIPQFLRKT